MEMVIGTLSNDKIYKELFEQHDDIKLALTVSELDKHNKTFTVDINALLIDGNHKHQHELGKATEQYPDIPIFYKLPDGIDRDEAQQIQYFCSAYKVKTLPPNLSPREVTDKMYNQLKTEMTIASKQTVVLYGTHSGAGVSTTTFNLAESISAQVNEKVLVLSLNAWDPSDYFFEYNGKFLNDLKVDLQTKSLTPNLLERSVHKHKNFYHLAGNRDIKLQRFYRIEEIEHLLDIAKKTFDLVLIDGGTHFDTAVAAETLVSSDLRFIVTTQEDKGYRGYFPHVFEQLLEPAGVKKSEFMLLINRYNPNMSLISEKDLEDEMNISRLATIPDMAELGPVAVRQKELLYNVAKGEYKKNIDIVSNLIISEIKLSIKDQDIDKNPGLFGKLFTNRKPAGVGR
ncbi:CpaE family protein [Terribacillus saccharophilus]|uniref:AAA family ATPase n=1 Tax=Terribacillus saccharophilus TaxID=361277 RepID=UPI00380E3EE0